MAEVPAGCTNFFGDAVACPTENAPASAANVAAPANHCTKLDGTPVSCPSDPNSASDPRPAAAKPTAEGCTNMAGTVVACPGSAANSVTAATRPAYARESSRCTKVAGTSEACPAPITAAVTTHRRQSSLERSAPMAVVQDQRAFWTAPLQLKERDLQWLIPAAAATAVLMGSDRGVEGHLPTDLSLIRRSRTFSDYGAGAFVAGAGGMYLWGHITHNDRMKETGWLSGEAALSGLLVAEGLKHATGRQRPLEGDSKGEFRAGGSSFPSEHATAAWSIASVIAHEYPSPFAQLWAYGGASAVAAARVTGDKHWASDALVGSAIGWYMGRVAFQRVHSSKRDASIYGQFERAEGSARQPGDMGSPYVPLDSWVYAAFDRIAAMGYVQTGFAGLRPWTRLECARLLDEAAGLQAASEDSGGAHKIYAALAQEFAPELERRHGVNANLEVQLDSVYARITNISGPILTDGYDFGQTLINDFGRPYQRGWNGVSGVSAHATAGPLVVYVRGEYQHAAAGPALSAPARETISQIDYLPLPAASPIGQTDQFRLLEGYIGLNIRNWQLTFGKQSLWWGPGQGGPMMLSDNAAPINMLRFNRVTPFKLPGILGWLGPIRTEYFLGQLSGYEFVDSPAGLVGQYGQSLKLQPFIHGEKVSFEPTANFQFGVFRTTIFGGPGYPMTAHTFLRSLFSTGNQVAGSPIKPGDRRSGVDFSYRIPKMRNWLTFYGDGFTDDEFSPIGYFDRSAWHAGIYAPRVPGIQKLDFRAEGVYTDNPIGGAVGQGFYYFNWTWRTGYQNAGNLIGSWIGRDGQGAQTWATYHFSPKTDLQFNFRHQKVSQQFLSGGGTLNDVGLRANLWCGPAVNLSALVQYEKWNYPVLAQPMQANVTTSLQLTFWPSHRNSKHTQTSKQSNEPATPSGINEAQR